ncbi:MAG: ATP-binding cassette domain-containing protein [Hymenobacter sp.]
MQFGLRNYPARPQRAGARRDSAPALNQGQVMGIYGRSGIGKSVLCRLLAGLTATQHRHRVRWARPSSPVRAGAVGYVQQRYPFNHLTLLDNLLLAARRQHGPPRRKPAPRITSVRFGLAAHARKYPAHLSGGQRQRAAIAQQLLAPSTLSCSMSRFPASTWP